MGFPMTVKRVLARNGIDGGPLTLNDTTMLAGDIRRLGEDTRTLALRDATRPSGDEALRAAMSRVIDTLHAYYGSPQGAGSVQTSVVVDLVSDLGDLVNAWNALATPSSAPDVEGLRAAVDAFRQRYPDADVIPLHIVVAALRDSRS